MNEELLRQLDSSTRTVELRDCTEAVEGAECDELWSFVRSKDQQRWLWYAIDHATGKLKKTPKRLNEKILPFELALRDWPEKLLAFPKYSDARYCDWLVYQSN